MIDFTSAWNVTNLGWNNPEITGAIITQAKKNTQTMLWSADEMQISYAKELGDSLPEGLNVIGKATGGTEANEMAIKTARAYTGRNKIIGFKDTYHGQLFATLSLGYAPNYAVSKAIGPLLSGFIQMEFPTKNLEGFLNTLEQLLKKEDVAGIVCEAGIVTGWGSTLVAPKKFLSGIRQLSKKYGTLMILDEVGTGFSRTGTLFGMQHENITPDIVTFAKGISNGAGAIGAMVTTKTIAEKTIPTSNLTSTFGWSTLACAAALKTLQIHKRDKIWLKAEQDGEYLIETLKKEFKDNSAVDFVEGVGMEVGVHLRKYEGKKPIVRELIQKARIKGLHITYSDDYNMQLMPPLTIERSTLDKGIEIFVSLLN
jgi:acetylornithine/succinyldiaminopimelate/putrescine aminotransferase